MLLENYFNFINETCIRIQGTRVGIETVVEDYENGASPEEIVLRYRTLSLEQVYATILYYLANKIEVKHYVERVHRQATEDYAEWLASPTGGASDFVIELRKRLAEQRVKLAMKESPNAIDEAPILVG